MATRAPKETYGLPTTAYVMERLAEVMNIEHTRELTSWDQVDPGQPTPQSSSSGATCLHDDLRMNAELHARRYGPSSSNDAALRTPTKSTAPKGWDGTADLLKDNRYLQCPGGVSREQVVKEETSSAPWSRCQASIAYHNDEGVLEHRDVENVVLVTERFPLLAMAVEDSRYGPRLYLEALSTRTAMPFLQFLHTGGYALSSPDNRRLDVYGDVPTSVLLHCEMYRLGDIWDSVDLRRIAYVNILRQFEFGCSSPDVPIDLCDAIRFTYENLRNHDQLVDAIINYCISCFLRHRLSEHSGFRQLAYELRPFHQDLCKNCINRDFEAEAAAAIIQLPFEPHRPETYASREDRPRFDDVVYHFHGSNDIEMPSKRQKTFEEITLPIRTQNADAAVGRGVLRVVNDTPQDVNQHQELSSEQSDRISVGEMETGYEVVGSLQVEEASSDDDSFVKVEADGLGERNEANARQLTIRSREGKDSQPDDSDSDWSLV